MINTLIFSILHALIRALAYLQAQECFWWTKGIHNLLRVLAACDGRIGSDKVISDITEGWNGMTWYRASITILSAVESLTVGSAENSTWQPP